MHSHYHHNYHHYLVFSLAVTRIFKIILTSPDHNSITNALSPLPHHWHSLYNSLITDNHAWRNKLYNARNWQGKVHKTERMKSTSVCHSDTNLQKFCLLEGNLCRHSADKAVTWKIPGSKSRTGSVSLTASRLVSTGLLPLGQSGRVVNLTNHLYPFPNFWYTIKVPVGITLQLYEQERLNSVKLSGTEMYGKEWAGCSADWYSALCEG